MPMRLILSAYVGPMPRPVVPILRLPRKRSPTLSRVTLYGVIRCALPLMSSLEVSMPRSLRPRSSESRTAGSTTTPLPMTGVHPGRGCRKGEGAVRTSGRRRRLCGRHCCRPGSALHSQRIHRAGRWPFLALVTPLSSEQHKSGHRRTPLPDGACPRSGGVRRCTPQAEPSDRYPGIDEGPGAIAQGPLAQRCYPRKDRGVGSRAHHEPCGRAGRRSARARRPGRPPS